MQIGKQKEIKQLPKVEPFKLPKRESPEAPIPISIPVREKEKVNSDPEPIRIKTISWDSYKRKFISPARPDFIWTQDGLAEAFCAKNKHAPPDEFCTCGIYATFDWNIAKGYDARYLNVMLIVEPGGKTIFHEYGFRSEQLRFVGAIRQPDPIYRLATMQAADFYSLPIMEKNTALTIMDIQNCHLLNWYEPVCLKRTQAINLWKEKNEYSTA